MQHENVAYQADGLAMRGELYVEAGSAPRAGVLVFPEAFGLGDHARGRAERLAREGYAALACDLHGEGRLIGDLDAAIGLIRPLMAEPHRIRERAGRALDALLATGRADASRIAAIGFCFGGTMALELARGGADIRAAVGFHSGLGTQAPATAGAIKAKVLACIGGDDPMIDGAARTTFEREMKAAGCDWQLHVYGNVVHSFTNQAAATRDMPEAIRYDAAADRRSWAAMTELFGEVMGRE
jgi:dienelactone hydrolase